MSDEDLLSAPATDDELREAEVLRRALEKRRDGAVDVQPIDDALGAALLLRSLKHGELGELRMQAVRARVIKPGAVRKPLWFAAIAAAIALLVGIAALTHKPSALPPPSEALLRAQLQAARPNGDLALLDAQLAAHRAKLFAALPDAHARPR